MPRPRIHDESVRIRLVEVASQAIAEGGPSALSLRAVARAADTTTAAIYTLFGSKEALVEAVVDEASRRFAAHLEAVPHTDDPFADLLALGLAYRANALENPHFYRVLFSPDSAVGVEPRGVAAPTFVVLRDAVARATGAPAPQAEPLAVRLWALAHGLVSLEIAGMLPGGQNERERAYTDALLSARP